MPDNLPPVRHPVLSALLDRASVPVKTLREPVPDDAQLELAVSAALRAPDHGGLRPWRFLVFQGEARAALGEALASALRAREPDAPAERIDNERAKPFRAPLVVAVAAALRHGHKIPVWEQEAAAAAGAMNLILALEAMGWGAVWLSSAACREPSVAPALGLPEGSVLLGWINLGTPPEGRPAPARPSPAPYWRQWRDGAPSWD